MRVVTLPKGGIWIETPAGPMQFGAPSETIKDTLRFEGGVPQVFLLGRELFNPRRGVSLADVEFPVYYQLFVKRRPLTLVGTQAQIDRVLVALHEAILGPAEQQLDLSGDFSPGAEVPDLKREWRYFRRGPYARGLLHLEDAVHAVVLDGGRANLGAGVEVRAIDEGYGLYWAGEEQVRLPALVPLPPEREVSHGRVPTFEPPPFGVTPLGRSHGFDPDPNETTSGFVLWIGGRGVMVDPPVYSTERLREAEIDPRAIEAVLLTHCHADHDAGTLQKAIEGGTVTLFATPGIFASYRRKWSAISGIPEAELAKLFDFRPVRIGTPQDIFGAQVLFRFTLHSIPTVAFEVHYGGRSFNYSSDTLNDPERVQAIFDDGGLDRARRDELLHFDWDHDLVFHEAGVPPLHTPLEVLCGLPDTVRRRVRVVHTTPSKVPADAPVALAGQGRQGTLALDVELAGERRAIRDLALLGDIKLFRKLPLARAADLLGAAKRLRFHAGQRFIEEGGRGDALYLITAGKAAVVQKGRELKVYGLGDYIGETAVFLDQPRNADVVAKTDLEVLAIDAERCRKACEGTGITSLVRRHAKVRDLNAWDLLEDTELFSGLSAAQKNELETLLVPVRFAPGSYLTHAGAVARHLFVVLEGAATEQAEEPRTLGRGDLVGSPDVVLEGRSHATSTLALTRMRVFRLAARDLEAFVGQNPGVRVRIQPWQAKDHITSDAALRLLEEYL